jgi:hypothetical protein
VPNVMIGDSIGRLFPSKRVQNGRRKAAHSRKPADDTILQHFRFFQGPSLHWTMRRVSIEALNDVAHAHAKMGPSGDERRQYETHDGTTGFKPLGHSEAASDRMSGSHNTARPHFRLTRPTPTFGTKKSRRALGVARRDVRTERPLCAVVCLIANQLDL